MLIFSGEIQATFDEKGRVVLPADYKNQMGGSVPGGQLAIELDRHEKCLNVYPMSEWEKRVLKITSKANRDNKDHSRMLDGFFRRCRVIQVPDNCRFSVPSAFLLQAGITKEVVIAGQFDRLRIWDSKEYQRYVGDLGDYDDKFDQMYGGEEVI